MEKTRAIKSFPRRMATNDNVPFGLLATVASASAAWVVYLLLPELGPAGIEAYSDSFGTMLMALAALASMRLTLRNSSANEQNRMSLNHQLRATVRTELMGQLTLEDTDRLIAGKTVRARQDFSVWLKRDGREVVLMTDKLMGYKVYQTAV